MLTIRDAADAINDGITRTQIKKWLERDLVEMPHLKTGSQGIAAEFSDYDLLYFSLVNRIVNDLGAPVKTAAGLVDRLFQKVRLTPQSNDLLAHFTDHEVIRVAGPYHGQHAPIMLLVDARMLFSAVLERAAALRAKKGKAA